jgi:hypothetical protein
MKGFSFRLQGLLHLRESLEKLQGANLGHAERAEGERRASAEASDTRLAAVVSQAAGGVDAPRAAGLYHVLGLSVEAARASADHAADELRAAEAQRAQELERFNEARSARRVLEKLRERRAADWDVEAVRQERREAEEQVMLRLPTDGEKQ